MKKVILLTLLCAPLWAQQADLNMNRVFFGQAITTVTARSLAMGSSGLAGGNAFLAATHNPALAVNSNGTVSINGGLRLYNLEEDRAFPYVDNFEGFVDYGSYFFQNNWYGSFYGQIVYAPQMEELMNLHISSGLIPFINFEYNYFEEVRSDDFGDALLAYNIRENEGVINSIPFNVAAQPFEGFTLGAGAQLLMGDVTYNERIQDKAGLGLDSSLTIKNEIDGTPIVFSAGATYAVDERLTIAAAYRAPYTIKTVARLNSMKDNREIEYPGRLAAGIDYRFENILAARIMVDYYYEYWADFEDSWFENLNFEDTYNLRVGVEHLFFDDIAFRAGLNFGTLRENRDMTYSTITVGTGFIFNDINIDLAIGFSNTEHFQNDLYPNEQYGLSARSDDTDRVNWTEIFGRLDFTYTF